MKKNKKCCDHLHKEPKKSNKKSGSKCCDHVCKGPKKTTQKDKNKENKKVKPVKSEEELDEELDKELEEDSDLDLGQEGDNVEEDSENY